MLSVTTELLSRATVTAMIRNRGECAELVEKALGTARAHLALWRLTPVHALSGGSMSVVVLVTTKEGLPAVLKVPLDRDPLSEATALRVISGAPGVIRVSQSAMLLEYVEGAAIVPGDSQSVAEALACVSPLWSVGGTEFFTSWDSHLRYILRKYTARAIRESPVPAVVALACELRAETEVLAAWSDVVPSHGDLQTRNLMRDACGIRVLDPFAVLAPAGFDAAWAVASVMVAGGDPCPVMEAARYLGVNDFGSWARVAVLAAAASSDYVASASASERVLSLL